MLQYEFVGRCDEGDVCVFSISKDDKVIRTVPFIYAGVEATVIEQADAKIIIWPKTEEAK